MIKYLFSLCLFLLTSCLFAADWKLVWSDEFDYDGLPDKTKWIFEEGFVRNQESQYYTQERKENARVENGMLIIEAREEKYKNPGFKEKTDKKTWQKSREYADFTSASVTTKGTAAWKYGRIEVKAKLPTGRGMWPAIWMLGTNIDQIGWPACGEIDIMENVGFDPNKIHANVHTKKYNHVLGTNKGSKITIPKPYDSFHIYAIEWNSDHIDFFVDNNKYFTFKNEGTGYEAWPFDKEHYLILNIAVGGSWGGQQGIDKSVFPQKMIVDYVRVYQQEDSY